MRLRRRRKVLAEKEAQAEEILARARREAAKTRGQNKAFTDLIQASAPKLRHNQIAEIIREGLGRDR